MSRPLEALAEEVLQLPADARAKLLDRVVASLDADRKRDEAWDALAARRDVEIESGQDSVVDGAEVMARLRAELKRVTPFMGAQSKTSRKHSGSIGVKPATDLLAVFWMNSSASSICSRSSPTLAKQQGKTDGPYR